MTINASGLEFKELNERIRNTEEDVEIKECMGQRFIASGLSGKHIKISGVPGNALGAYLNGAEISVFANAAESISTATSVTRQDMQCAAARFLSKATQAIAQAFI